MAAFDLAIIGGGIVGLATAYQTTQRFPNQKVVLLEKEAKLAEHQTGHNSGVLHYGIYYEPGSLKATNCRAGKLAMETFCRTENIPFDICGKVIVALDDSELPALQRIYERGLANGVICERIGKERLNELEPFVAGIEGLHVPETGIVDYRQVCERLGQRVRERSGEVRMNSRVTGMTHTPNGVVVHNTGGDVEARYVVNCAGLHCDRITALSGQKLDAQIVPFRGEYFELKPSAQRLCKNLIYPVPDPKFPFLGVHFTRLIGGGVECGPNAVLAFGREGYQKTDVNLRDLFETLTYPGFLRMAAKHWRMGMGEMWRSWSKGAFVQALQRLVPAIRAEDLVAVPAGIRAQAVMRDGSLVDDFLILEADRVVNVVNAPSPAATASLNVGTLIVDRLAAHLV